jgi:hypothetical protein
MTFTLSFPVSTVYLGIVLFVVYRSVFILTFEVSNEHRTHAL